MRRTERISAVVMTGLGTLLLIGCAGFSSPGSAESHRGTKSKQILRPTGHPSALGHVVHIVVPFFPDDTDQCGPATLAGVLAYWGVPSSPEALKEETYTPRLGGTLPIDLLLAVQARGLQTEGASGSLDTLKAELDANHPVVALLNLGWAVFPQGHYVLITGYDERRQGVYMHSGLSRDVFVPYARFLADWEKTGRWMLRIQPIGRRIDVYG